MHIVSVQQVDYDDYPMGMCTKIGPFESRDDAEVFLRKARGFHQDDYGCWRFLGMGRYTVTIKSLIDDLIAPENYLDSQR